MMEVLLIVVVFRILLGEASDHDERQTAVQGRAAKYALWTFLGYAIIWMWNEDWYKIPIGMGAVLLIGWVVVLLVYLTMVIVQDAYTPLNFPGFHWLLLLFGIVCVGSFFFHIRDLDWTGNSVVGWSGLGTGIVMIWSSLLLLGKRILQRSERE